MWGIVILGTQAGLAVFRVTGSTLIVSVGTIPSWRKPMPVFKKSCSACPRWGESVPGKRDSPISSGLEEEARLNRKQSLPKL